MAYYMIVYDMNIEWNWLLCKFRNFIVMLAGKAYDFVSFASMEPDETVFVSSATESKIGMNFKFFFFKSPLLLSLVKREWFCFEFQLHNSRHKWTNEVTI